MVCEEIISRVEARERGLKRYYTGKPCKYGHLTYRRVSDPRCAECIYLKNLRDHKRWRDKNKDKIVEYRAKYFEKPGARERKDFTNKRWRDSNPEKCNAYSKKFRQNNPEKAKEIDKRWRDANPEKCRIQWGNRRAREMSAEGSYTPLDIKELLKLQRGKCAYYGACKTNLNDEYHVDHIVALVNGGTNFRSNLQLLCPRCNLTKHAKDPIVFSQELGFLL